MTSESWFAIDSDDSSLRNRKITTVVLGSPHATPVQRSMRRHALRECRGSAVQSRSDAAQAALAQFGDDRPHRLGEFIRSRNATA